MRSTESVVASIGAELDGVVPTARAYAAGVTPSAAARLRRRGVLIHVCRGVDRLRDHPLTWRSQCRVALAVAGHGAVLCLRSAARLHGFYAYRSSTAVEVVVPRGRDHDAHGVRLVESRWLPDSHVTSVHGLPVTTAARTFFDLCGDPEFGLPVAHPAHERAMIRVYNDAIGRRGLSFTQEAAVLLVMAKRGRNGTRLVRRILTELGPTYAPTMSDTESLFLELVHAYALPEPEKQATIVGVEGWIGTVDFLWRDARLVVEIDSSWHDGPIDRQHDALRDERLRTAGYIVRRYRYGDLVEHPAAIARELAVVVAGRPTTTTANSTSVTGAR